MRTRRPGPPSRGRPDGNARGALLALLGLLLAAAIYFWFRAVPLKVFLFAGVTLFIVWAVYSEQAAWRRNADARAARRRRSRSRLVPARRRRSAWSLPRLRGRSRRNPKGEPVPAILMALLAGIVVVFVLGALLAIRVFS